MPFSSASNRRKHSHDLQNEQTDLRLMAIDKELYRQAQEYYRQWNVAKLRERAEMAGKLSSQELWQRYLALIEFGLSISRHPSDWQRQQKLDHVAQYYERVQKMEEWRRSRA
ncbi:hypothetical protein EDS67_24630 [candidate division KSB1 bacterium]|nr:MAG: hypothetical protein EDS67_24630 [candidate division KSB1 bacterium]